MSLSACEARSGAAAIDDQHDLNEARPEQDVAAKCGPEVTAGPVGSEPDFAALWLERVRCLAEQGDADSQLKLGIAYRDGSDGPPQDYSEAEAWFRRAAEQGVPMAQYNLGQLYQYGRGVPRDLVQAHFWYNVAAANFDFGDATRSSAFARRDEVGDYLTPQQLAEAQRLATAWWGARNAPE